jgi:hypothetical protein
LPIQINTLGLIWDDFEGHPENFDILLSASVVGLPAVPGLQFSGTIEGVRIRPSLLAQGKFPVVDIQSIGVSIKGSLFGGEVNGSLIGGILKIKNNQIQDPLATDEPDDRVFFVGVQGGFDMAGIGGFNIQFALSELGPLGVLLRVNVPITVEPFTGLTIGDFTGGVEFFKTLPSIEDPLKLRDPAFTVTATPSAATWLTDVKNQVLNQYLAVQASPNKNGFAAAFTAPMLIKGSAKIYSIYTSQAVFNGQVSLIISTDGKILIGGQLNFLGSPTPLVSVSGKLYADLSRIDTGNVVVLFLADVPDQVRLLSIDGKLKMGFRNETGQEVAIPVANATPANTTQTSTGTLAFPTADARTDVAVINASSSNGSYYIDVLFRPAASQELDYGTILDPDAEISATLAAIGGLPASLTLNGTPQPIEVAVDSNGLSQETPVTANTQAELIALLKSKGVQRFRYQITDAGFQWEPGVVQVTFNGANWQQANGTNGTHPQNPSVLSIPPREASPAPASRSTNSTADVSGRSVRAVPRLAPA